MAVIEIAAAVRRGARTASDVLEASLDAIARLNPRYNAFVHVDADGAQCCDGRDASACGFAPFTMLANFCWNPAISVPAGLSQEGLLVGLQIVGRRHADDIVLRLARILEQARPWPQLAPARGQSDRRWRDGSRSARA